MQTLENNAMTSSGGGGGLDCKQPYHPIMKLLRGSHIQVPETWGLNQTNQMELQLKGCFPYHNEVMVDVELEKALLLEAKKPGVNLTCQSFLPKCISPIV